MSWISGLAGKAENFLNKVDQSAASALHKDGKLPPEKVKRSSSPKPLTETYSPYLTQVSKPVATRPDSLSPSNGNGAISFSASVPSNLNKLDTNRSSKWTAPATTPSGTGSARQSPVRSSSKKDKDEELFEFLNSKDNVDSGSKKKVSGKGLLNGEHSRQSSVSSTNSSPTCAKTPEVPTPSISVTNSDTNGTPSEKSVNGLSDSIEHSPGMNSDDNYGNHTTEPSSGYISNQEDMPESEHLSSLELENRLLKNEVTQLNQEMTSVLHRAREAQDELAHVKRKLGETSDGQSRSDQVIRELQSQESDLQEALHAKDSQLAVLRIRLEEADKELAEKRAQLNQLISEKNRILKDHTSSTDVQSQALDTLKSKLREAEYSLQREQEAVHKIQQEAMTRQNVLENEKEQLSQELALIQKRSSEGKGKCSELSIQLKSAKSQVDAVKSELQEYKEKATRILQSKDKLIMSLKEGAGPGGLDSSVSVAELEEMRQERDMFREEVHRSQMTTENLRTEMAELEAQLQQESDLAHEQISSLEEQLHGEKDRREDAEQELNKQKQELRYAHEELLKQKTAFQSRIHQREHEIEGLRNQLTNKSMSTSSEAELENRLHALTESLIHKQTMLEALSTEKNSLVLQLERMERQYREAESAAQRVTSTTINMNNEDDEVRNRMPMFMRESPLDSDVARKMKRAANTIDRFSMRMGVFLRRYPIARIFVICYMAMLHLWVSIVLLTYNPEVHTMDYLPRPPGP